MNKSEIIKEEIGKLGIVIDENQCNQFLKYYDILIEWNSFMNLTGITEFHEVVTKHFADSLSLIKGIDLSGNMSVLDLGTGAGFPGIPLKIVFPNLNITLMDSLNKRIKFLNEVIDQLSLTEICAVHGRAEDLGRKIEYRENFDLCVSRAVSNLASLSEYCVPFVKKNGYFISYKSGKIEEELNNSKNAIKILGGKVERVENFNLIDTDMERSFVIIKKCMNTAKIYPRSAGKPTKEPLK